GKDDLSEHRASSNTADTAPPSPAPRRKTSQGPTCTPPSNELHPPARELGPHRPPCLSSENPHGQLRSLERPQASRVPDQDPQGQAPKEARPRPHRPGRGPSAQASAVRGSRRRLNSALRRL